MTTGWKATATSGDDVLQAQPGQALDAGGGNDLVFGSTAADDIKGGAGNDIIWGRAGSDTKLDGGIGEDIIHGGAGDDKLVGGQGNDTLDGGDVSLARSSAGFSPEDLACDAPSANNALQSSIVFHLRSASART